MENDYSLAESPGKKIASSLRFLPDDMNNGTVFRDSIDIEHSQGRLS